MKGEYLMCEVCGYREYDHEIVRSMKRKFKGVKTDNIPYFCDACLDVVSEEEYYDLMKAMKRRVKKPK
jgi:uncharacterized Zn finger protein